MDKNPPTHLLNRRVLLRQPEGGFRTSIDAVLLAAACRAEAGQSLLDMGCGTGAAGLCVLARVPGLRLTGFDIQADHVALARENAALNDSASSCDFLAADVAVFKRYDAKGDNVQFDHVICNPPYNDARAHTRSPSEAKALAMGHAHTTLQDWIDCASRNVKSGGSFTLIHKADQLDRIILAMGGRFGAIEIVPLQPRSGREASRVILRAIKGRKTPTRLHPALILHEENGDYTAAADAVLRDMKPL